MSVKSNECIDMFEFLDLVVLGLLRGCHFRQWILEGLHDTDSDMMEA